MKKKIVIEGTKRTIKRFAWTPMSLEGWRIFLEHYWEDQIYVVSPGHCGGGYWGYVKDYLKKSNTEEFMLEKK